MSIVTIHRAPTYSGGSFLPPIDDAYDLGSTTLAWQDGYFDGVVYTDTIGEFGSGQGVTIDSVLLKDGYVDLAEATLPAGTRVYVGRDNTGDLTLNVLTGKTVNLAVNGTDVARMSATALAFQQATTISTSADDLTLSPAGNLVLKNGLNFIGDTANAQMTVGLTINQGAADDEVLAFKSSDVAHPFTSLAEADTFGDVSKAQGTKGGFGLRGFKAAGGTAYGASTIYSHLGVSADTTKTAGGYGILLLDQTISDGATGKAAVNANGNLVSISSNEVTRFIFDNEGDAYADVQWITYQHHDDLALVEDIEQGLLALEDAGQTQRRHALEEAGIIGKGSWHLEDGRPRAMVNFTRLAMLHHGALLQVGQRLLEAERENKALHGRLREMELALQA